MPVTFKITRFLSAAYFIGALVALCWLLINGSTQLLESLGMPNLALHVGGVIMAAIAGQLAVMHLAYIGRKNPLIRYYLVMCLANSALSLSLMYVSIYPAPSMFQNALLGFWGVCHVAIYLSMMLCCSTYFQLPQQWRNMLPITLTALLVSLGVGIYFGNPLAEKIALTSKFSVLREIFLALGIGTIYFMTGLFRPFKLAERFSASVQQRFLLSPNSNLHKALVFVDFNTALVMGALGVGMVWYSNSFSIGVISLSSIGVLYSLLSQLYEQHQDKNFKGNVFTRNAAVFHDKYLAATGMKSAVVGNKTATFVIDHDPFHKFTKELPASLVQIRNEEVMKCVDMVLGDKQVHGQFINNQIYGAINPEFSERPCVDSLLTFACLFLDASPLIERKLTSLFDVLPIIDPELHSLISESEDFRRLFNKNDWFYYFNYRWVDQWIAVQGEKSQYRVNLNTLPISDFIHIHRQLSDESADTQHIIIGEEARERLMFEAPAIGERLKPYPIRVEEREIIVFVIDLETLIVMLDQYFDLNNVRERLRDYPPGEENMKILEICDTQVRAMHRIGDLKELVKSMMNHAWHGFIEKGRVLKLISSISGRAKDIMSDGKQLPADFSALLLEAVQKVGYPSQLLHSAQMQKLALRDRRQILQVAGNSGHVRFVEAWVYLSNLQAHMYPEEAIQEIVHFLLAIPSKPALAAHPVVHFKGIDCLVNLAKDSLIMDGATLERLLASSMVWACNSRFSPRACSLLLDGMIYLLHCRQGTFSIPEKELAYFQSYLADLRASGRIPATELDRIQVRYRKLLEKLSRQTGFAA